VTDTGKVHKNAQQGAQRTSVCVLIRETGMTKLRVVSEETAEPEEHDHAECRAVGQVLDRIGDKWTVMVVGTLAKGPMRFNAVMRAIGGVSHRMLTLTLRGLERDGLVKRTAYPTIPPKVEYELTDMGRSLIRPLKALATWAHGNRAAMEAARARFDQPEERSPSGRRSSTAGRGR
jgi:DNA-binding HxlR family transcriptional regulator